MFHLYPEVKSMKFENISFSVIGGDQRQIKLCNYLIGHGYSVNMFGFSSVAVNPLVTQSSSLEEAVKHANVIIGPIPCSQNDKDLFTRYYDQRITVEDVLKLMNKRQIFMAGRLTDTIQKLLAEYDLTYIDLLEREDMAIRNAIPTKAVAGYSLKEYFAPLPTQSQVVCQGVFR